MTKRALITGITGQDGSYLAELLLEKGYEVHGIIRRASTFNTERIDHIYQDPHESDVRLHLHYGDLTDGSQVARLIRVVEPDEVYNLGAQSHVAVSFQQPEYTADVDGLGAIRILEAIRDSGVDTRFYQAGTSEMFGDADPPQSLDSPFQPRSPYAAAKVYAYWVTRNYREAYDLYAVNGILFNHECVPAGTPVIVRDKGLVDIRPIEDLVPHRTDPASGTSYTSEGGGLEVWDGSNWARVTARSANWKSDQELVTLHGRGGVVEATPEHVAFLDGGAVERPFGEVEEGASLHLGDVPTSPWWTTMTATEAWLLGLLVADGYISQDGRGRITNSDDSILADAGEAWVQLTAGDCHKVEGARSEFSGERVPSLELTGNRAWLRMVRGEVYTRDGHKRVPKRVLNAPKELQVEFLRGYYLGDGLKAGNGTDEFRSLRTTSDVLAAGIVWLARSAWGRQASIYRQPGALGGGESWLVNFSAGRLPGNPPSGKGAHLRKPSDEVRQVTRRAYTGWVFDLATTSGRFAAGVGFPVIHNSPRRGPTFVTRKITRAVAAIVAERQKNLFLGNLDAKRDWGHAKDYVRGMWMMLQQDQPEDYVLAMGETHTVREFAARAFAHVGLDWAAFTHIDPAYYRPTEVEHLHGDPSDTIAKLGWKPEISFDELVKGMVEGDLQAFGLDLDEARARVRERSEPGAVLDGEPNWDPSHGPQPPTAVDRGSVDRTIVERDEGSGGDGGAVGGGPEGSAS